MRGDCLLVFAKPNQIRAPMMTTAVPNVMRRRLCSRQFSDSVQDSADNVHRFFRKNYQAFRSQRRNFAFDNPSCCMASNIALQLSASDFELDVEHASFRQERVAGWPWRFVQCERALRVPVEADGFRGRTRSSDRLWSSAQVAMFCEGWFSGSVDVDVCVFSARGIIFFGGFEPRCSGIRLPDSPCGLR